MSFFEVTLADAKARWASHTKRVLNSRAQRLADDLTLWDMVDGTPLARLGVSGQIKLYFYRNAAGHVYASREKPPAWFERQAIKAD